MNNNKNSKLTAILAFLVLALYLTATVFAEPNESAFSSDTDNTIAVTISSDDLTSLTADGNDGSTTYSATVTINGTEYDGAGIRVATKDDMTAPDNGNGQQGGPQGNNGAQQPNGQQGGGPQGGPQGNNSTQQPNGQQGGGPQGNEKHYSFVIQLDYTTSGAAYNNVSSFLLMQMPDMNGEKPADMPTDMPTPDATMQASQSGNMPDMASAAVTINGTDYGSFSVMDK